MMMKVVNENNTKRVLAESGMVGWGTGLCSYLTLIHCEMDLLVCLLHCVVTS